MAYHPLKKEDQPMLKYLIALVVLGTKIHGFSFGWCQDSYCSAEENCGDSLACIERGYGLLLDREPHSALKNFEKAISLSRGTEKELEIRFLVDFGRVVSDDMLGHRQRCEQAIGDLFLTVYALAAEEEIGMEDYVDTQPDKELLEVMKKLIAITPSQDVRALLFELLR